MTDPRQGPDSFESVQIPLVREGASQPATIPRRRCSTRSNIRDGLPDRDTNPRGLRLKKHGAQKHGGRAFRLGRL